MWSASGNLALEFHFQEPRFMGFTSRPCFLGFTSRNQVYRGILPGTRLIRGITSRNEVDERIYFQEPG